MRLESGIRFPRTPFRGLIGRCVRNRGAGQDDRWSDRVYSSAYMTSAFRHGRLWAWLILLVAGLGPVHAFVDEIFDACPIALSEAHDHEHDAGHERDFSESDPCHEHCAIGRSIAPSWTNSVAIALFADRSATPPIAWFATDDPGVETVHAALAISRSASPSAYHQRVGLRLYA